MYLHLVKKYARILILYADIICSSSVQFTKCSLRKTVSFEEQIASKRKYLMDY